MLKRTSGKPKPKSKKTSNKLYGFTTTEAAKLKELLSNSSWSTKGYPDGAFAEDTETPKMIFSQIHAEKLRQINEFKNAQCDIELAIRQKAIKEILNDENGVLVREMNKIKNELLCLENEKIKMEDGCNTFKNEIEALAKEHVLLGKKKQRLIKKIAKANKEVIKLKEEVVNATGNGTIKDLEV